MAVDGYPGGASSFEWEQTKRSLYFKALLVHLAFFVAAGVFLMMESPFLSKLLALNAGDLARGQLWKLLTYPFYETNPLRFVFNMLVLWFFLPSVEQHLGKKSAVMVYFFGALAGALVMVLVMNLLPLQVTLFGATAPVTALFFSFVALYPEAELFFRLKAKYWALIYLFVWLSLLLFHKDLTLLSVLAAAATGFLMARHLSRGLGLEGMLSHLRLPGFKERTPRSAEDAEDAGHDKVFISEDVDPILDKISRHGMQSLSAQEKKILEKASKKLSR